MPNNAEAMRRRKESRIWIQNDGAGYWYADLVEKERHGVWGTYTNWYCRCDPCTAANALHSDEVRFNRQLRDRRSQLVKSIAPNAQAKREIAFQAMHSGMVVGVSRGTQAKQAGHWREMVRDRMASLHGGALHSR